MFDFDETIRQTVTIFSVPIQTSAKQGKGGFTYYDIKLFTMLSDIMTKVNSLNDFNTFVLFNWLRILLWLNEM